MVGHKILCQNLCIIVLSVFKLSCFKSYLGNSNQHCRINGVDSKMTSVEVGIPQGSCLVPLLVLIYLNDIPCIMTNFSVSMYVDETSIYHSAFR